jgi:hypothetical protein
MPQLPAVRPHLGKLQTATALFVVRGRPSAQCQEMENTASIPACSNCKLLEGESPHPANYRGGRHAKEELQKRKSQRTPKTTTGSVISSNRTTPGVSFAAAFRGSTGQIQQPQGPQSSNRRPTRNREPECASSCRASTIRSVSSGSEYKQSTSGQYIASSYGCTANYDRVQWCCVGRRQNSGHY